MELVLAVLLGAGLSASAGLNAFLPLLLLGAAARFQIAGIALNGSFAWLTSDLTLGVLIVASILEIIADKIPAVDHALHSVGTILRPVAGTVAAASVLTDLDPGIAALLGLIIGAPTSLGFHTLKSGTRVGSSATTFGCANPVLSVVEDVISFVVAALSILAPLIVPLILGFFGVVIWQIAKRLRRRAAVTAPAPSGGGP
ncbi:MAG TPA: DUF4126 domain-containing protein [Thermoanaerobaculia bacterium]|nr:DUF4126 domain-containing protein [Thermoanaerobaculia bacterium]